MLKVGSEQFLKPWIILNSPGKPQKIHSQRHLEPLTGFCPDCGWKDVQLRWEWGVARSHWRLCRICPAPHLSPRLLVKSATRPQDTPPDTKVENKHIFGPPSRCFSLAELRTNVKVFPLISSRDWIVKSHVDVPVDLDGVSFIIKWGQHTHTK